MKSITPQIEAALTAFLNHIKTLAPTALGPVNMYPGQSVDLNEPYAPPSIIAAASGMKPLTYLDPLHEGMLKFTVETQIDDDSTIQDATAVHHARVDELRAWLDNFDAVAAIVNAPPSPATDNRPVKDFTLSALAYENETQLQADRHLVTELDYHVAACALG